MINSESDLYKYQEFKFRKIEYWPDDNSPDDNMLFCIQYATKNLERFAVFSIPISQKEFNTISFRVNLEMEFEHLELIECVKKLLKKHPELTQNVLESLPLCVFGNQEQMMEIFETIKYNKKQIMIANYVVSERSPRSSKSNYKKLIENYNINFEI